MRQRSLAVTEMTWRDSRTSQPAGRSAFATCTTVCGRRPSSTRRFVPSVEVAGFSDGESGRWDTWHVQAEPQRQELPRQPATDAALRQQALVEFLPGIDLQQQGERPDVWQHKLRPSPVRLPQTELPDDRCSHAQARCGAAGQSSIVAASHIAARPTIDLDVSVNTRALSMKRNSGCSAPSPFIAGPSALS